jgi:predicted HicB family RNase H-like nuclease
MKRKHKEKISVKVKISLPKTLHQALVEKSKTEKISVSTILGRALENELKFSPSFNNNGSDSIRSS